MLKKVSVNGYYRYSKVSFLANQSGTADNFVSMFFGDEVFLFWEMETEKWETLRQKWFRESLTTSTTC